MNKNLGIYIHIPFCGRKCIYCDFLSIKYNDEVCKDYFDALHKEIEIISEQYSERYVDTIFVGGGTPSVVPEKYIVDLMNLISKKFYVYENAEITIESNPGTLSKEKLSAYKKSGFNRISIGLQAAQDYHLKQLGRIHSKDEFYRNYRLARECGFENINIDLIFGLPDQTIDEWAESLKYVTELNPEHISCYSLIIEEGTQLFNDVESGKTLVVDELIDRQMYEMLRDVLVERGFIHYEISNFSKRQYESAHNLKYWTLQDYLGLGVGAHSFIDGVRFKNTESIQGYCSSLKDGIYPSEDSQFISQKESMGEFIFLGLRLINGISVADFQNRYQVPIHSIYGEKIEKMVKSGLLIEEANGIRLTNQGLNLANKVFVEFI